MSYSGKKPVFKKIYTDKTNYKNYVTMPKLPEEGYYSIYFRFGRPYFLSSDGSETALLQDLTLSESMPIRDYVYEGQPVYLYNTGNISYRHSQEIYKDFTTDVDEEVIPIGLGETDKIKALQIMTDYFYPNRSTLIQSVNNDILGFHHNTASAINLNINSSFASCSVNQLDSEEINIVYLEGDKIHYSKYNKEFESISTNQPILTVNNLKYLKCLNYTLKNDLTTVDTKELFVVIYIDDTGLNTALFTYKEKTEERGITNKVNELYLEEYLYPYHLSRYFTIKGASLINTAIVSDFDGEVKHLHIGRTENNATCKITVVAEHNNVLTDYTFEATDVSLDDPVINYLGSSVSRYPVETNYFGSMAMLSERDEIYYTIGNTVYLPSNDAHYAMDLSSEGAIRGINNVAKYENISVIFIDRTVEITVMPSNGFFHSREVLENNFIMPEGSDFVFSSLFDLEDYGNNYIDTLRTLIMFLDSDSNFCTRKINDTNNVIEDKSTPRVINTYNSDIFYRFVKPITQHQFVISGEEENKVKFYDYATDVLTEQTIEIQENTTGIVPYVLPIRYATNVRRYIVISKLLSNTNFVSIDARTTDTHGLPYSPVEPAVSFNLNEEFNITDLLLIKDSSFLIKNNDTSIHIFTWDELTSTMSRDVVFTQSDFNNNQIKHVANGNNGNMIVATISSDNTNIRYYKIDSSYNATLLKEISTIDGKCFLFSFESGVMCLTDGSEQYIDVYDNQINLLSEFNYTGLIDSSFIDNALEGFSCSTLKDIRAGNARYTFVYNHITRTPSLSKTADTSKNISGVKHDCVVMPENSLKASSLVSRAFFEDAGDFSNLLIDYTSASLPISNTVNFYPSSIITNITIFGFNYIRDSKSSLAFINISGELIHNTIEDGFITSSDNLGVQNNILEIKPFCSYNDNVIIALRRENSITMLDGVNDIELTISDIQSFDVVTFKTSVTLMILDIHGNLYVNTFIFNNDHTIIHKVQNELYKTDVESFSLTSSNNHFASVLINTSTESILESFMINEFFIVDDSVVLGFRPTENVLTIRDGVVTNSTDRRFYFVSDYNKINLLDNPQGDIVLSNSNYQYKNIVVVAREDRVELFELDTNSSILVESIRKRVKHAFKGYTVSPDGIITVLTSLKENWYIYQYKINLDPITGQYIGVSQEDAQFPFSAVVALRGGVSAVHQDLPIAEKVWSSDGTVELGLALSANRIHLSHTDIEKVETPENVSPENNKILLASPTVLIGSPSGTSLFMRNIIKRHFRIATDKQFTNIVYEATEESPFSVSHTITDFNWVEERRVYYYQCQDENDLGYKSAWSIPFMFSVSLESEVAKPEILSPDEGDFVDIPFTITATNFDADPAQSHVSTDWEIYENGVLFYSSYDDTVNLTSLVIDSSFNTKSDAAYSVRVRYTGSVTGKSPYSNMVDIRREDIFGVLSVIEEDYPNFNIYRQDIDTMIYDESNYEIDQPCNCTSITADKNFIAVGANGGDNLYIFKNIPGGWEKILIADKPSTPVHEISFYNDYLAVASGNQLKIYKRQIDDFFVKLGATFNDINGYINSCNFSSDGEYLAVVTNSAPFLHIYKRNGDVFTAMTIPTPPTVQCLDVAISYNGDRVIASSESSPFILSYHLDSNEYLINSDIENNIITAVSSVDFRPDANRFVVGLTVFPFVRVFEWDTDDSMFKPMAIFTSSVNSSVQSVKYSSSGNYIATGIEAAPFLRIYKETSKAYTLIAPPEKEILSSIIDIDLKE